MASLFECLTVFTFFLRLFFQVESTQHYDKKTIDGMVLKMLWTRVYVGHDPKTKEKAIKQLKKTGDYDKLINHLLKVKKEKVPRILELLTLIIIEYMR